MANKIETWVEAESTPEGVNRVLTTKKDKWTPVKNTQELFWSRLRVLLEKKPNLSIVKWGKNRTSLPENVEDTTIFDEMSSKVAIAENDLKNILVWSWIMVLPSNSIWDNLKIILDDNALFSRLAPSLQQKQRVKFLNRLLQGVDWYDIYIAIASEEAIRNWHFTKIPTETISRYVKRLDNEDFTDPFGDFDLSFINDFSWSIEKYLFDLLSAETIIRNIKDSKRKLQLLGFLSKWKNPLLMI